MSPANPTPGKDLAENDTPARGGAMPPASYSGNPPRLPVMGYSACMSPPGPPLPNGQQPPCGHSQYPSGHGGPGAPDNYRHPPYPYGPPYYNQPQPGPGGYGPSGHMPPPGNYHPTAGGYYYKNGYYYEDGHYYKSAPGR